MDDDDYYPPERVSHAVEMLLAHPEAMAAGSSEIYIYFKHIQKMYQFGPYMPNHATAGTFAFRRELLNESAYQDEAAIAEERAFLKNYTVPMVQLDPLKTILVFSHIHNTYDKKKLLETPDPRTVKESPKTIDMFIRYQSEAPIKKYFLQDIDKQLANYDPGDPKWKPEVFEQMKVIQKERDEMIRKMQQEQQMQQQQQQQQSFGENSKIMINEPGKPPRELSMPEIIQVIQQLQERIQTLESQQVQNQNPLQSQNIMIENQRKQLLEDKVTAFEMENKYLKERISALQNENKKLLETQKILPPPGISMPTSSTLPPTIIENVEIRLKSEPEITLTF
jgi:hypothetical protein